MLKSLYNAALSGVTVALLASGSLAFADSFSNSPYTIGYYTGANQNLPDAQMHVVNPGSIDGYAPQGSVCANVYVFTPDEQMVACCSCNVSPNGMQGFSLKTDLVSDPFTSTPPLAGAIKIVASLGGGPPAGLGTAPSGSLSTTSSGLACDAGSVYPVGGVLDTWITHVRPLGTAFGAAYSVTEIPFEDALLSLSELQKLEQTCYGYEAAAGKGGVGSGAGICNCESSESF
jgi:hypothetical protein